jgi:excisionase family DNA binding protein
MPADDRDDSSALAHVTESAAQLRRDEEQHRESASGLALAMQQAHERGYTWSQIALAAGLASPKTARTRAERAMDPSELSPSVRWRQQRGHAPRPKAESPGISVTEAARRLEVTRKTVYTWLDKGRLTGATDEAGRTRVLTDAAFEELVPH